MFDEYWMIPLHSTLSPFILPPQMLYIWQDLPAADLLLSCINEDIF